MKKVFGGTMILALASLGSFAAQPPAGTGNQPDQATRRHSGKKARGSQQSGKKHARGANKGQTTPTDGATSAPATK